MIYIINNMNIFLIFSLIQYNDFYIFQYMYSNSEYYDELKIALFSYF